MQYPMIAPINWYLTSAMNLEARDTKNTPLPPVAENVDNLIASGEMQKFTVELAHNPTATAGTCCLYQKQGGVWVCVKTC